jgi:hypothetical protein
MRGELPPTERKQFLLGDRRSGPQDHEGHTRLARVARLGRLTYGGGRDAHHAGIGDGRMSL